MGAFPITPPTIAQSQRKLRPSNFKKLVEKFNGTKDPHNHMANIEPVIRAKQANEWNTQFEGFGMTLDGLALDWLQDIPKNAYTDLKEMEKDFIEALFLTSINHKIVT